MLNDQSRQSMISHAQEAYSQALQIDHTLGKAWAVWGNFNDQLLKDSPNEVKLGMRAMVCYLHACQTERADRSKRLLARVLNLLAQDAQREGALAQSFDEHWEAVPTWYWITYIPQLLNALSRPEINQVYSVLQVYVPGRKKNFLIQCIIVASSTSMPRPSIALCAPRCSSCVKRCRPVSKPNSRPSNKLNSKRQQRQQRLQLRPSSSNSSNSNNHPWTWTVQATRRPPLRQP